MSDAAGIRDRIETVEEAYEFMLAYAAQGRADEGAGADGAHIRTFLTRFERAVGDIADGLDAIERLPAGDAAGAFAGNLRRESEVVASVLRILLARDNISSEIVDNANGLIAVRAYLTSLFFLDKGVLPPR